MADPIPQNGDMFLVGGLGWMCRHGDRATGALARRGAEIVPLVYDTYPIVHPEWVDPRFSAKYAQWFASLLRRADRACCISRFTAQEVASFCRRSGTPEPPMTVVRLGDAHAADFLPGSAQGAAHARAGDGRRKSLVYVSTVDPRKNHELLVEAWRILAARRPADCPDLIWVGDGGEFAETLWESVRSDASICGRISWRRGPADGQLAALIDESVATLYPSRYEGWGLPVAESLARGRVCLVARATSLPEICPAATPLFDPDDPAELVGLIGRLLDDPDWLRHLHAQVRAEFSPTSWDACATQVLARTGAMTAADSAGAHA